MRSRRHLSRRVLFFATGLGTVIVWRLLAASDAGGHVESNEGVFDGRVQPVATNERDTVLDTSNLWESNSVLSRQLLSIKLLNCTPRAVEQFPHDLFTQEQRQHGAVILHFLCAIYMFLALALVCDYYFVPSLEVICELLNLQSDVAGATFMAAGSSAPELATAVIGVFIAKDDVGLGTVVGSAIYNVMFVISICGLYASTAVSLNWWPMVRDCLAYLVSVGALVVVIYDEMVFWYEAAILCFLYFLYIVLMYFNARLERWFVPRCICCPRQQELSQEAIMMYDKISTNSQNGSAHLSSDEGQSSEIQPLTSDCESEGSDEHDLFIKQPVSHASTDEPEGLCNIPESVCGRFMWLISLPLNLLLAISIPDCRRKRWRKCFIITFTMSLVWLSAFSFLMVWMITVIGYTTGIPDSIMGLTFVAFGVSLPDVIASVIVMKDGLGDMAVSNAIGSNVFDILICLGVPWLLRTAVDNPGSIVQVYSEGLTYSSLTLMSTVVFLLVATHLNGWKLDRRFGVILLVVYVLYTVLASLYELNIFGYFHPPECPFTY